MELNKRLFNVEPSVIETSDLNVLSVAGQFDEVHDPQHIYESLRFLMIDQGRSGSCVGQAIYKVLSLMHFEESQGGVTHVFNPWYIWMNRPNCLHKLLKSEGTSPKCIAGQIVKEGSCFLTEYEIDPSEKPLYRDNLDTFNEIYPTLVEDASVYKADYYIMPQTEGEVKQAILDSNSVAVMIPVYKSFARTTSQGIIPNPDVEIEELLGYHEMLVYGWNEQGWIGQNSYGEDWGNDGFFVLPYDYPIKEWVTFVDGTALHWADKVYYFLKTQGVEINDRRFDDNMTRGEVFTMIARLMGYEE